MDEKNDEMIIDGEDNGNGNSSIGLDENVAAVLAYLATFISGIIFLFVEKKSEFVRFHAMQSTVLFVGIWVLRFCFAIVPFFGWLLAMAVSLLGVILWIVMIIKAYQKEYYKLPVVGDLSEDFLKKLNSKADG